MSKEKVTTWYIEPIGSHSNKVFTESFNEMSGDIVDRAAIDIECRDGKSHSLFCCHWSFLEKAQASRKSNPDLKFRVWKKEGNGSIRLWKGFGGGKKKPKINVPASWGDWEKHRTQ